MPKVSVIIPIYGVEKYLRQCLDSVVSQSLRDIEIILVDDGSKDSCPTICDEYAKKDKRIVVIHKKNTGYGHSINMGIAKAKGNYIGIVEADDWVDSNMFEQLYQKATEVEADFVKSNFYKYSGKKNTNEISNIVPREVANITFEPVTNNTVMNKGPSIWAAIYKKEFLIKNNIKLLETPGASYQDTGFHIKTFFSAKKAYFFDKAFYHYRVDNEGSSVKDTNKIFCVCDEWSEIIRWAKENETYNQISGLLCALEYNTYIWNFKRLSGEIQWQFLKRFSMDFKEFYRQGVLKKKYFRKKKYKRLMQIIFHPMRFLFFYRLKHLPNQLLKKLRSK